MSDDVKAYDIDGSLRAVVSADKAPKVALPKVIRLVSKVNGTGGSRFSLTIDGVEFPWVIADDGIDTTVSPNNVPSIRLTMFAESVEIVNEI